MLVVAKITMVRGCRLVSWQNIALQALTRLTIYSAVPNKRGRGNNNCPPKPFFPKIVEPVVPILGGWGDISPPNNLRSSPQYFRLLEKWSKIAKNSVISENFRLRRAVCCFYCARLLEKCSKFAKTFVIPENFRLRRAVLSLSFQLIFNIESIPPQSWNFDKKW